MAGAARPGTTDARDGRVPCPLCGGLLHPIAGKCKHCKADLTAYRAVRPAADAPLPALSQPAAPAVNGHHVHAPIAHAVAMPAAAAAVAIGPLAYAAQPVLPPRPSTRMHTAPPAPSAWRSWPIFVIVVAMMAIVAAVVLMMWPAHTRDGKRALQPPPAPERMDTQTPPVTPKIDSPATPPPAPQGSADPWGMRRPDPQDPSASLTAPVPAPDPGDTSGPDAPNGPGHPGVDGGPHASADPLAGADPDVDAFDPFSGAHPSPSPMPSRRRLTLNRRGMFARAMNVRLCQKLVDCGQGDSQTRRACGPDTTMPDAVLAGCPAARRCLVHLDAMTCPARLDATRMAQLLAMSDCLDALRC